MRPCGRGLLAGCSSGNAVASCQIRQGRRSTDAPGRRGIDAGRMSWYSPPSISGSRGVPAHVDGDGDAVMEQHAGLEPAAFCLGSRRAANCASAALVGHARLSLGTTGIATSCGLYVLPHWTGRPGSNRRHQRWQRCTLPTELLPEEGVFLD